MDRNSLRTSVVIEVANQEEPEDQKTYQIDFDDLDIPKDYVIDQVFCGENITVYALFETPGTSDDTNISSNDHILEVGNLKPHDSYRLLQRNTPIKTPNSRKHNMFKRNMINSEESKMSILPNSENGNEKSFYCLKHLNGNYEMLTPERENSDLKVLYSKGSFSKKEKSTKFKAVSKGVNTDIVQSPKIINDVQKAVKQNIPIAKLDGKSTGVKSISSGKPSYEVIEMDVRQSFTSLSSFGDNKKPTKKSVPNFFLVPLLMMEDGVLSHFQNGEKIQKLVEEKERKILEKVTVGTNTDLLMSTLPQYEKRNEADTDVSLTESTKSGIDVHQKQSGHIAHGKLNNKSAILTEIKKLQGKLTSLIKSIESDTFEPDTSELESSLLEEFTTEKLESSETMLSEFNSFKTFSINHDNKPILSTLTYPQCKTVRKRRSETRSRVHEPKFRPDVIVPTKSSSMGFISVESLSKSQIMRTRSVANYRDIIKSKEEIKRVSTSISIIWSDLENRKGAGLSKSATNGLSSLDPKLNFLNGPKKSLSFDLRDVKLEVVCLKKIKNASFKLETKQNIRIPQTGKPIMKCEMGDEAFNKPKTSKIDLLSFSKPIEKVEDFKLEKEDLDTKETIQEEGDAKRVYSGQNLSLLTRMISRTTEVHFCNTINTIPKENLLSAEKSLPPIPVKSKGACSIVEMEPNVDKPTTPSKTSKRSTNLPNTTPKKEAKPVKKVINSQPNKFKMGDRITKSEIREPDIIKQRSVTGSRKFTLKGTAESKLHVDRLIKPENSKTFLERTGMKTSRLSCQKREPVDHHEESKENAEKLDKSTKQDKTEKPEKTDKLDTTENPQMNSPSLKNRKISDSSTTSGLERIREDSGEENEAAAEKPGVVVELLSEKPPEKLCPDENQKCTSPTKDMGGDVSSQGNGNPQTEAGDDSENPDKPVVKSVWALTKVLLFEDGTRKVEILEASLTPPGYTLPQSLKSEL